MKNNTQQAIYGFLSGNRVLNLCGIRGIKKYSIFLSALLLSLTFPLQTFAQDVNISGKVLDEADSSPLPGVNITVKGTTNGTVTDGTGAYTLSVPSNSTLVFSYIGYTTQEIAVSNRTSINVNMASDVKALSEVVVVGYGTQKKADVTGATATVTAKDLNVGVINNPLQSVQGRVAGLNIVSSGGDPTNNRPAIRLRGTSSLSANSEPLIVVDGVAGVPLNAVAPEDIQSVDVLKDASAAAIYGSRGANGVIIITTKRGIAGKTTVEYNGYVGVETPAKFLPFLSADEYRSKLRELNLDVTANDYGASTNWFKELSRNAVSQNHSLAVSGGTDKFSYRGSLVYLNQPGIMHNSSYDRLNGRLNLVQKALDDKLEIQLLLSQQIANKNQVDPFAFLLAGRINPTIPVYNDQGTFLQPGVAGFDVYNGKRIPGGFEIANPLALLEQIEQLGREKQTLGNVKVSIEPVTGLKFGVNGSISNNNWIYGRFQPSTFTAGGNNQSAAQRDTRETIDKLLEITGQYSKTFGTHNVSVLGGYTYQKLSNEGFRAANRSFPDVFGYSNLNAGNAQADGTTNREVSSYKTEAILVGFLGRINYSFNEKYLLTANIRRDGSSRFGSNNRWGWFPSVSVGWRIGEESFLKNTGIFSDLKLRAGYGVTGNQEGIYDYAPLLLYGANGSFLNNGAWQTTYGYSQNANPDLKWETSAMTNIGVDFSLLQGRLNGSLEVYSKDTRDLLFSYPIAIGSTYGSQNLTALTSSVLANVGEINNRGIEFAVDYLVIDREDFQWKTNLNLAHNRNKIVSLSSGIFRYDASNPRTYGGYGSGQGGIANPVALIEGYPIGQFYGPVFQGFGTTEKGEPIYNFKDIDGDGSIDPFGKDRTFIGDAQPRLVYSWGNNFTYKRFDLSVLFRGALGHKIANGPYIYSANPNRFPGNNVIKDAFSTGIPAGLSPAWSDFWVEKGDFVRLDNWRLSYKLPTFWKYVTSASIFVAGNNTFVITKYRGIDPEPRLGASRDIYGNNNDDAINTNLSPGLENITFYPRTRSFTAGVSLNF
ncbi:TonB-dependent receptor [Rhodocytophaga rosea]|uniref:TonB-dependent receptor n=1 Tax=Rhodocytophaga rosea TaxID=2704465 RepID=A0A6C0GLK0_9BACT|nr:TonB-dependent receptor [Rhodocytophaga rosea]QHT68898.1 TonB-dependent receptor [Rhodocytophaga rosea]